MDSSGPAEAPSDPADPAGPAPPPDQPAAVDVDCSVCHDVLVDPVVCPCGHDFCRSCYYNVWVASNGGTAATSGARRGGSRAQCPLCRAPLPARPPAVCVRLRAAVEAAAGERVAARREELAERHSQRLLAEALADAEEQRRLNRQLEQRLASFQAAAAEAAALIHGAEVEAAALHEENGQLRRTVAGLQDELAEARRQPTTDADEGAAQACIQLKARMAALLPFPPPPGTPDESSYEESRWLFYQQQQQQPPPQQQQGPQRAQLSAQGGQPGALHPAPWVAVGAAAVACAALLGALLARGGRR